MNPGKWAVGLIVLAQWLGTSLWFSPNSAADDLMAAWQIGPAQFAWLIAAGFLGCVLGGRLSLRLGSAPVAACALLASGLLCLVYPLLGPDWLLTPLLVLLAWGFFVVADSPQFSSLSARSCPPQSVGSALATQNSIGFSITSVSITVLLNFIDVRGSKALWILLPGPVLGLLGMWPLVKRTLATHRVGSTKLGNQ